MNPRIVPLPKLPTVIGLCCREWVLAVGSSTLAPCGYCGQKPTYLRPDTDNPTLGA